MIVMAIRKISVVFITGAMTFEAPNDAIAMSMKTGNVQPEEFARRVTDLQIAAQRIVRPKPRFVASGP
jgi:hypothetical protein